MPEKCTFPPCSDENVVGVGSMNDCPTDIDQKAKPASDPASDPASAFDPNAGVIMPTPANQCEDYDEPQVDDWFR